MIFNGTLLDFFISQKVTYFDEMSFSIKFCCLLPWNSGWQWFHDNLGLAFQASWLQVCTTLPNTTEYLTYILNWFSYFICISIPFVVIDHS